jgi:MOSC domain-containing protein YiiM
MNGRVVQINRKPETPGQHGLPKLPVSSIHVTRHGLEGDFNRFRHDAKADDPSRAVLLLPLETIQQLNAEGWPVKPGDMGENITTEGIPYDDFVVGDQYRLGEVIIQITEPCTACRYLESLPYVQEAKGVEFITTLTRTEGGALVNRRGWYASVVEEGTISQGDAIEPVGTTA